LLVSPKGEGARRAGDPLLRTGWLKIFGDTDQHNQNAECNESISKDGFSRRHIWLSWRLRLVAVIV
jgi:hypothetical protein